MADKQSQAPASSTFGQHDNAYVPHHISDHTKALQMSVRTENGWVNINDTLDQMNDRKDLHAVHDQVEKAQEDIGNAQSAAQNAVSKAESAVKAAAVTSDTISNMSDAVKTATVGASDAVVKAEDALANMDKAKEQLAASISSNSGAIALKADKTEVDRLQGSVNEHSASIDVLNNEIKNTVTESNIEGLLDKKGYATQTYTQGLVTQTAKTWGANFTKLTKTVDDNQSATVKQMTNLQTSIDGIQGTVVDNEKKTESRFTQLADGFQSKVFDVINDSTKKGADFNSRYQTISDPTDLDTMITVGSYYLTGALTHSPYTPEPASSASDSSASATSESASTADSGSSSANSSASAPAEAPATDPGNVILEVYIDGKGDDPTAPGANIEQRIYREGDDTAYSRQGKTYTLADDKKTVASWTWHEWSKDADSSITQLKDDINWKVSNGDLISQINMEAGRTLIDSNKIYLNADSVVFSKGSKAFIPSAAITEINADKITTGTLKGINIYGNDIVSFNKDESEQYSFVQIDEGGIYLGEAAKPDPSLIDYTERIGYTKVARIYSSKDADLTLVGNQINVKAPNYIHTSSDGTKYSTRTNLIINTVQPKNYSITTSAAGLFVTSQPLKSSKNSGYNDKLFGKVLTSRYETNESVWQSEANQIGAISGLAMDEDYLALQAPKKVTVNLSGDDSESSFDVQKNNFFTASFGADGSHDSIQLTANGRIGFHSLRANTIYFDHGDHGANHDSLNTCMVFGNFAVAQGQKNAIVKTSQGLTAIHAYETAEYYFGDIGENNTGSSSKVIVGIDQLFDQTVNTDVAYQVFLTPYSNAHLWVEKRYNNRFVVCSDQPNAQFGWELKARRKGYEHTRLTNFSQQIQ